jgi:putative glutathione S-transferase
MGRLVNGEWSDEWYDTRSTGGRFAREKAGFRGWVTPDGRPGPAGQKGFSAQRGRYHLYVALACPWSHRTLIARQLKGLQEIVSVSSTHFLMGERGWTFEPGPEVIPDMVNHVEAVHQLYTLADPRFTGRATVPVLWDIVSGTIVSNESSDIIRMFNDAFDEFGAAPGDYYPIELRHEIDPINARVYDPLNNGVYRAGFATSQAAYDEAVSDVFAALDWLEDRLRDREYLTGERLTEADIRLFPTLIRFDLAYVGLFKCNLRRLSDYPQLSAYLARLARLEAFRQTLSTLHIKQHYYGLRRLNPSGIVPIGPALHVESPHAR